MKVAELIKRLKKLNPDAEVVIQDHDHGDDEMNGPVFVAEDSDSEILQERFSGPVVVIR